MKSLGEINATLPEGFEIVVEGYSGLKQHGLQYGGQWVYGPEFINIYPLRWWRIRRYARIARRLNGGVK